jgi:hypothetical protein
MSRRVRQNRLGKTAVEALDRGMIKAMVKERREMKPGLILQAWLSADSDRQCSLNG